MTYYTGMFEITYTFLGKHSLTFFFNTLLSFVFKDCPLKQKHSTIIPLGFANDQKTESETKVSTEHTARNNGITVACLLVSSRGKCKSKTKKTTL